MKKTYIFEAKHIDDVIKLSKRLALIHNIKTTLNKTDDRVCLSIDFISQKDQTFDNVVVLVGSLVLSLYKTEFVTKNLSIPHLLASSTNQLIVSLVAFDYEAELLYISNLMSDYDKLEIRSFWMFCLDTLRIKWGEFVFVVNSTLRLENTSGFVELIKFLTQGADGVNEINLYVECGKIRLCDYNQNIIEENIDLDDIITLITMLANHSPKVINIHNLSVLGKENYKILNYVFPNKLNTLV